MKNYQNICSLKCEIEWRYFDIYREFDLIKNIWLQLLATQKYSFFMSWGWICTWLNNLPVDNNISFICGSVQGKTVTAFFLVKKKIFRNKVFKSYQISLNNTLIPAMDQIYIEYNSILKEKDYYLNLYECISSLFNNNWDEILLDKFCDKNVWNNEEIEKLKKKYNIKIKLNKSHYIDLEDLRQRNLEYKEILSKSTRVHINRSLKEFAKIGPLKLKEASTKDEAFKIYEKLIYLHQKLWTNRGKKGSFSNLHFKKFHYDLINNCFEKNEIQLIEITCGENTIGCLYNFIYNNEVLCYQSGFLIFTKNVFRPGLVSHYLSVLYNFEKGISKYDFLVGEERYKKSLATQYRVMEDIVIQKKKIRFYIESILKKIKNSILA